MRLGLEKLLWNLTEARGLTAKMENLLGGENKRKKKKKLTFLDPMMMAMTVEDDELLIIKMQVVTVSCFLILDLFLVWCS